MPRFAAGVNMTRSKKLNGPHTSVPHFSSGIAPSVLASSPFSCRAALSVYEGALHSAGDVKFAVVVARFNSLVTKGLLEGALSEFERHGVPLTNVDVAWVPGAFELPVVSKAMANSGKYGAVVCIAAVIRGATTHYDAVVSATTGGVLSAGTDSGVPVIFGVLTTDDLEQALDRTGGKVGNKGGEAAITAIEMASLLKMLKADGKAV